MKNISQKSFSYVAIMFEVDLKETLKHHTVCIQ